MSLIRLWEFHNCYKEGDMTIHENQCIQFTNGEWVKVPMPVVHDIRYKSWNPERTYSKNQLVVFNGQMWECIEDHFCDVNPDNCEFFENKKIE